MKNKSPKPAPKPKLKTYVLVPITDPAEQAALDLRCKQAEETLTRSAAQSRKAKSSKRP
jgi:hypothetical protein